MDDHCRLRVAFLSVPSQRNLKPRLSGAFLMFAMPAAALSSLDFVSFYNRFFTDAMGIHLFQCTGRDNPRHVLRLRHGRGSRVGSHALHRHRSAGGRVPDRGQRSRKHGIFLIVGKDGGKSGRGDIQSGLKKAMSVDDALRVDQWEWGCRMEEKTSWAAPFFSFSYCRFAWREIPCPSFHWPRIRDKIKRHPNLLIIRH